MATREQSHPFYRPLWRRVVIVAVIAVWLGIEIYRDEGGLWLLIAAGAVAYAVFTFFITWPKTLDSGDKADPKT